MKQPSRYIFISILTVSLLALTVGPLPKPGDDHRHIIDAPLPDQPPQDQPPAMKWVKASSFARRPYNSPAAGSLGFIQMAVTETSSTKPDEVTITASLRLLRRCEGGTLRLTTSPGVTLLAGEAIEENITAERGAVFEHSYTITYNPSIPSSVQMHLTYPASSRFRETTLSGFVNLPTQPNARRDWSAARSARIRRTWDGTPIIGGGR